VKALCCFIVGAAMPWLIALGFVLCAIGTKEFGQERAIVLGYITGMFTLAIFCFYNLRG